MKSGEILLLTSREIQTLLTLDECIGAVEHAFREYGEGRAVPPAVLSMHTRDGGFHLKAGLLKLDRSYFANYNPSDADTRSSGCGSSPRLA